MYNQEQTLSAISHLPRKHAALVGLAILLDLFANLHSSILFIRKLNDSPVRRDIIDRIANTCTQASGDLQSVKDKIEKVTRKSDSDFTNMAAKGEVAQAFIGLGKSIAEIGHKVSQDQVLGGLGADGEVTSAVTVLEIAAKNAKAFGLKVGK